jgi:hypothetical protein
MHAISSDVLPPASDSAAAPAIGARAVLLAEGLLAASHASQTAQERREAAQLARLMADPAG